MHLSTQQFRWQVFLCTPPDNLWGSAHVENATRPAQSPKIPGVRQLGNILHKAEINGAELNNTPQTNHSRAVPKLGQLEHYNDVIMSTMASQITSLTIVYSSVYSGGDQRKHQSSASLAFVRGIHRGPMMTSWCRSLVRLSSMWLLW